MGQVRRSERGLNPGSCPVTAAMEVIAPKWAGEVWKQLAQGDGPRGSEELLRSIPGLSRKMLTEQLREFESAGVVRREVDRSTPPRVSYALTEHGRALGAVWTAIWAWGNAHLRARETRTAEVGGTLAG
jgi:DNA-binding HxlR family transcriptional regulator